MAEVFLCQGDAQFAFTRTTPYNPVALGRASNYTVCTVHQPLGASLWGRRDICSIFPVKIIGSHQCL